MAFLVKKTIAETFLARVATSPQRVGFVHKVGDRWVELTFSEFYDRANLLSHGLMNLGIGAGDTVAILSDTRLEWSLTDMAIMGARAITVPMYPSGTDEEWLHVLRDSKAKALILEKPAQLERLLLRRDADPKCFPDLKKIIVLDPAAIKLAVNSKRNEEDVLTWGALSELGRRSQDKSPEKFEENLRAIRPQDLLTICYTTGTTGTPKGALLTHDNMISVLEDCILRLGRHIRPEKETILSFLPFSHVLGKVESMSVYSLGCRQVFAEDPDHMGKNLKEIRPTLLFAVPRVFERSAIALQSALDSLGTGGIRGKLIRAIPQKSVIKKLGHWIALRELNESFGGRLRFAICGGAPLVKEVAELFDEAGIRILEGYGLTETCAPVTLNDPDHPRFGTVGRPLPEVHIRIAGDGEILVQSRKVFQGYQGLPRESAEALRDGWFRTGDVGYIDAEGYLCITDRKTDLIVTSTGKNIAPQKIENMARSQEFISELVAFGEGKSYVTALITLNQEKILAYAEKHQLLFSEYSALIHNPKIIQLVQAAVDQINGQLATHERIRKFLILPEAFSVESGELTASLKVRRAAIHNRYRDDLNRLY